MRNKAYLKQSILMFVIIVILALIFAWVNSCKVQERTDPHYLKQKADTTCKKT